MSNEVDLTTGVEIKIPENKAANIFPDSYYEAFNVTKEDEKQLWEKIKKEYETGDESTFDKIIDWTFPKRRWGEMGAKRTQQYEEELIALEQQVLDNKTNHISNVVGAPVENVGMTNLKDMSLVYDIARSKKFKNRKKKFLTTFPEGEYHSVPINVGDGKTETYEIFKYNSGDKKYKVLNPDGRNISEMAYIAGVFIDEQLAGDIGFLALPRILKKIPTPYTRAAGHVIDKIPPTVRVMMGNWLGLKGKKLNEYLRGFGEEEFDSAESIEDVSPTQFLFDLSDWGSAAVSGGAYKGMTELSNYLIKGSRPGMVEMTEEITRAAEALDLDPLIFAQMSTNPIVRRMFTQAGLFTDRPNALKIEQLEKLKKSLKEWGIGQGTGKLDQGQVQKLQEELALQVGDRIKMFNKNFATQKSQQMSLDEAISTWNKISTKSKADKTRSVFSEIDHLDGASINIDSFVRLLDKKMRSFVTKTEKLAKKTTMDEADNVAEKVVKKTGKYGNADQVFSDVVQAIKQMTTAKNVSKSNLPTNTLSQLNDKSFKNLETLFNIRDNLFKLTTSPDSKISGAAVELHNHLKMLLNPSKGYLNGSSELISKVNILNKQVDGMENVTMLGFVKEAFGKAKDPDAFVQQFLIPGSSLKVQQLKNILTEGAGNKVEREGAEAAFNVLRKAWFNNIIKQEDGIKQLNKWITNDLDGVKLFLGDGWQSKIAEMKNIIGLQNKLSDGVLAKSLIGTEKEIFEMIQKKAAEKGIPGHGKYFDDVIKDYGGYDSNGVEMIRFHIIKDMLDKSRWVIEGGKKMFKESIDPRILRQEIKKLQANDYLMKFFDDGIKRTKIIDTADLAKKFNIDLKGMSFDDFVAKNGMPEVNLPPPMIEALQNYNLYTTALAGQSDVGGMIAAGELANKTTEGIFKPVTLLQTGLSILKHDIIARLLSKKISSSYLSKLDVDNALSKENLQLINGSISELAKELIGTSTGYNEMEDNGIIYSFTEGNIDTSLREQGTGSGSMMIGDGPNFVPTNFNTDRPIESSSLGNQDLGFRNVGFNSNTYDKGSQLFSGPGEITFAAKGGIMNTTKAFQRVA